jgi:hypothetical protein
LVVGALLDRGIFSTQIEIKATVCQWLLKGHRTMLDLVEFDGLTRALPESLMVDPRTNTTNVLCFLDAPQSSSNWSYREQQGHNYFIDWYILPDSDGGVKTVFEV